MNREFTNNVYEMTFRGLKASEWKKKYIYTYIFWQNCNLSDNSI